MTDQDADHDDDGAGPLDIPNPGHPEAPEERLTPPDPAAGRGGLTAEGAEALIPKEVG